METTFSWITSDRVKDEHKTIKVNQVYVWILTKDNKIVLVSKDGQKWQLPGGHPQLDEVPTETAKVHFVKAFSIEEACEIIPWLAKTNELQAFKDIIQNI